MSISLSKINIKGRYPFVRLKQFIVNPISFYNWLLKNTYFRFTRNDYSSKYDHFTFLTPNESLDYLIKNEASLARFNDGEFDQLLGYGIYPPNSDWSQDNSKGLSRDIATVLSSSDHRLLVATTPSWYFLSADGSEFEEDFCKGMWRHTKAILYKYLNHEQSYGDCRLFVPTSSPDLDWPKLKSYLSKKNVIIATGDVKNISHIKLGKKNYYIECGKTNAYEIRKDILSSIRECLFENELSKDSTIVLASLGPTAGIIAYDLLGEVVVWDTGHIFRYAQEKINVL